MKIGDIVHHKLRLSEDMVVISKSEALCTVECRWWNEMSEEFSSQDFGMEEILGGDISDKNKG